MGLKIGRSVVDITNHYCGWTTLLPRNIQTRQKLNVIRQHLDLHYHVELYVIVRRWLFEIQSRLRITQEQKHEDQWQIPHLTSIITRVSSSAQQNTHNDDNNNNGMIICRYGLQDVCTYVEGSDLGLTISYQEILVESVAVFRSAYPKTPTALAEEQQRNCSRVNQLAPRRSHDQVRWVWVGGRLEGRNVGTYRKQEKK